jgi:SAM-dependent methyltransferase
VSRFEELVEEGASAPVEGWDFSWFAGRATEERPPWGYARLIGRRMAEVEAGLDVQTGGGEVLATIPTPPPRLAATESWPPNVAVARRNLAPLGATVHQVADEADLPFADESFDLVFSAFTHTDMDAFAATVAEAARTLRPGGRFVYVGLHPCFIGPHSRFAFGQGIPSLESGYAEIRRYSDAPGLNPEGLRIKVGAVHLPLGDLLGAFLDAGLRIDAFEEPVPDGREYPYWLALRAVR